MSAHYDFKMSYPVHVTLSTSQHVDKDELFVCPFDPVHRISAKRFVYHIHKCRKQHPHMETATCPFNARHIVLKPALRHHTSTCPDKRLMELEMNGHDHLDSREGHVPVSTEIAHFPGDNEYWDDEVPAEEKKENPPRNGFSSGAGGKKVNSRREAIKRMKEEMRRQMEENRDQEVHSRRPQNLPQAQETASVLQQAPQMDLSPKKLSSAAARVKPRLAPNFNFNKEDFFSPVPRGVGRGFHISQDKDRSTLANLTTGTSHVNGLPKQLPMRHAFGRGRCLAHIRAMGLNRPGKRLPGSGDASVLSPAEVAKACWPDMHSSASSSTGDSDALDLDDEDLLTKQLEQVGTSENMPVKFKHERGTGKIGN